MINAIALDRFEFSIVASVEFDPSNCIAVCDASLGYMYEVAEDDGYALSDVIENLVDNGVVDSVDQLALAPLTGREQVEWAVEQFVGFITGELNSARDSRGNITMDTIKEELDYYGYHGPIHEASANYRETVEEIIIMF